MQSPTRNDVDVAISWQVCTPLSRRQVKPVGQQPTADSPAISGNWNGKYEFSPVGTVCPPLIDVEEHALEWPEGQTNPGE